MPSAPTVDLSCIDILRFFPLVFVSLRQRQHGTSLRRDRAAVSTRGTATCLFCQQPREHGHRTSIRHGPRLQDSEESSFRPRQLVSSLRFFTSLRSPHEPVPAWARMREALAPAAMQPGGVELANVTQRSISESFSANVTGYGDTSTPALAWLAKSGTRPCPVFMVSNAAQLARIDCTLASARGRLGAYARLDNEPRPLFLFVSLFCRLWRC